MKNDSKAAKSAKQDNSAGMIQWHEAFQASIQIEFEEERDKLIFEEEHLLSKKPMQMDELIIKVKKDEKINKNIGRIFRGHNIIEYKNPRDNLTINDFYKVTAYCFFYQSDMETVCAIPPQELTITFICNRYPYKLIRHLKEFWKMKIEYRGSGIYYLTGFSIPIQILLTRELDPDENLWLRSLRTDLKDEKEITNVIKKFEENRHSKLRQAAMDAITRANWKAIREVKDIMCDALKELMAEELEEASSFIFAAYCRSCLGAYHH